MAFFEINEATIAVFADRGLDVETTIIGDQERAFSGALCGSVRTTKRSWSIMTPLQTAAITEGIRDVILGRGDVWHFNESTSTDWQYSVNGKGAATGTAWGSSLVSGKFGRGLRISATRTVTWTTNTGAGWTIMVWYYTGGAWHHYIVRSDAAKWVDGVRNDGASTPFMANTSTTTTLGYAGSGSNQDFDDLVVLPYVLHANFAEYYGVATAAFSDLPRLNLGGDILSDPTTVEVQLTESATMAQEQGATGLHSALSFTLEEA